MYEIDLGCLSEKQIFETLKEMNKKTYNVYATIMNCKIENTWSVVLKFENKKEKDKFDNSSQGLVKRLKEIKK